MRRAVAALVVVLALALPGTAGAHLRTGKSAVDFRAHVTRGPLEAVDVRIYRSDLALGLTVRPGHKVVVLGYLGEPFLRMGPNGVSVVATSPTAAGARVASQGRSAVWHDARVRGLPSGVDRGEWSVPLLVDGRRTRLVGEIERVPRPSLVPWIALGVVFAGSAALLLARRRPRALRIATVTLGSLAAMATLFTAIGFAVASTASADSWIESANEAAVILVGAVFLVRGSLDVKALAGGTLGLIAVAVALTRLPVIFHGIVLSALPGQAARLPSHWHLLPERRQRSWAWSSSSTSSSTTRSRNWPA